VVVVNLTSSNNSGRSSSVVVVAVAVIDYDGRDYVSELRPRTGRLFVPRVIREHGEPLL
jgi:hypothetical protein